MEEFGDCGGDVKLGAQYLEGSDEGPTVGMELSWGHIKKGQDKTLEG